MVSNSGTLWVNEVKRMAFRPKPERRRDTNHVFPTPSSRKHMEYEILKLRLLTSKFSKSQEFSPKICLDNEGISERYGKKPELQSRSNRSDQGSHGVLRQAFRNRVHHGHV